MRSQAPLARLRVFLAAARAESFQRAAEALSVTPGAVSRQIRELEGELGRKLFDRGPQRVSLNAAGHVFFADIGRCIDELDNAWRAAQPTRASSPRVSLSVAPAFARHWLLPRLADWPADSPHPEVETSQTFTTSIWAGEQIDLAIRYGRGPWPGVSDQTLLTDCLIPVIHSDHPLADAPAQPPSRARDYRLFEARWPERDSAAQRAGQPGWHAWLDEYDPGPGSAPAVIDNQQAYFDAALTAAVGCQGIVLASEVIVADRLHDGRLIAPFGRMACLATPYVFALISPEQGDPPPAAAAVMTWLANQASCFAARRDE